MTLVLAAPLRADCMGAFCELLVWHAEESGADNWAQVFTGSTTLRETVAIRDIPFGVDVGVRAGVERCGCRLYYTGFWTSARDGVRTTGTIASSFLGNFYINNPDRKIGPSYRGASIKWSIDLNMFDLEVGRWFCAERRLAVRPFIGVKGGWIDQGICSTWEDPIAEAGEEFLRGTEDLRNDFWGLGPSVGVDSRLPLARQLFLVGNFSGALMVGHWRFSDLYQNDQPATVDVILDDVESVATTLRAFLGVEWAFRCKRLGVRLRAGYEAQVWFNQLQLYSLNFGRMNNLLTLQGGTFGLHVDY
ncbi:MAG: Lpg1974 family pore-forming outer membrane protein [Parachlamydiales bacterium]